MQTKEYNPLDYENLTRNCVQELMRRGPFKLPIAERFDGAGVYALFFVGSGSPYYEPIRSVEAAWPIYVGKAEPGGGRKGGTKKGGATDALLKRLREHVSSISAADNLKPEDFLCRYLVVTPLWITMAERFLIEHYQPVWNICLDGFGNHVPGKFRNEGARPPWDILHPGRPWAARLREARSKAEVERAVHEFLKNHNQRVQEAVDKEVVDRALDADEDE
jgi:hypothetical protein